jgi:tetratricopeptide (TPR) repeat protein
MRYLGNLIILAVFSVLLTFGLWGCAPPPPSTTELTPEQQAAIEDSIRQAQEMELAKNYSYAFENYKTARTTENPQHKELYFRDAVKYFWRVAELDVESKYNIYGKLSDCYTQLDLGDSAVMVLEMGLEKFPNDTYLNQSLGYVYKTRGEWETSLQYYQVALGNEPENRDFLKVVGELYQKLDDNENAIATYRKYLELNPDDRNIQEKVTNLVRRTYSTEEYVAELISYLQSNPNDLEKRFDLAMTYLDNGENQLAIAQFQQVLEKDPKNVRALEKMGLANENLKKFRDAIRTYDKILVLDGTRKDIIAKEALDYVELGEYSRARQKAQQALRLDRSYGQAWVVMGKIYQTCADECSRGRQLNYYDRLVYLVAYGLFRKARDVGDYDAKADADRWISYLAGSMLIPQKEDWFLNKNKKRPEGDCYSWVDSGWSEMDYIEPYLARFED